MTKNIEFGSVCSGIEAASVAWTPMGWKAVWLSEIEPFPCALLKEHYPSVPNQGDMLLIREKILNGEIVAPDVFCGGTPCQAFSMAGARESLDDHRGQLSLEFCEIADAIDLKRKENGRSPTVVVWENVLGVLSTNDNAFGHFIAKLAGAKEPYVVPSNKWGRSGFVRSSTGGRRVAWRVLDAQYFGVPQRRKRVFVVASSNPDTDPREILFERESVQGNLGEVATLSKNASTFTKKGTGASGEQVGNTLYDMSHANDVTRENNICPTILGRWGTGGNQVPVMINKMFSVFPGVRTFECETCAPTLTAHYSKDFDITIVGIKQNDYVVRKLTPVECERLQGFPDDYTLISYRGKPKNKCPDSYRYKAIGNSWAIPVVRWIGQRINEKLQGE